MKIIRAIFASIEADKAKLQAQIEAHYVKASDLYEGI